MSERVGDIAFVLHSHMPYVEGFGTYPFGEEWLFDAVVRSHLPVLSVAADVTLSVTPVLADQLEAPGVGKRLTEFTREFRVGSAELDARDVEPELAPPARRRPLATAPRSQSSSGLEGEAAAAFAEARAEGARRAPRKRGFPRGIAARRDSRGRLLQLDAGLASHRRRFGEPHGFWLPGVRLRSRPRGSLLAGSGSSTSASIALATSALANP